MIEPQPTGAVKRAPYLIVPLPGRTSRVTPSSGKLIRGVFCRPGVVSGHLFVAAGSGLYEITSASTWTATYVGPISGGAGTVLFDSVGAKLVLLAGSTVYVYDGTTLTANADPFCPANAYTLASLGERVLTSARSSDTFSWCALDDPLTWPSLAFAASGRLPDEIRNMTVIMGEKWDFGASSAQPWSAVGGDDSNAFDLLSVTVDRGIAGRDAIAKIDASAIWVGDDRCIYMMSGYQPVRIINRDLETALAALTDDQMQSLQCFSHTIGSHVFWVLRMPTGKAYAFDTLHKQWSERTTWGASRYQPTYSAIFNGYNVVASDESDVVWTMDPATFTDAGVTHERVMTVHVPVAQRTIISSVALDMKTTDQPLAGTGSDPQAAITFFTDGGSRDSIQTRGVERMVSLGKHGDFNRRPMVWRLGMAKAADGMLIRIRITDPVNFAMSGVWINENPR
jgi:hypothetical protein